MYQVSEAELHRAALSYTLTLWHASLNSLFLSLFYRERLSYWDPKVPKLSEGSSEHLCLQVQGSPVI